MSAHADLDALRKSAALQKLRNQRFYAANKEPIKERSRSYYEANKERITERQKLYRKRYYAANKERIAERQQSYRAAKKNDLKKRAKRYRAANREWLAHSQKLYRDAKRESVLSNARQYKRRLATEITDSYVRTLISNSSKVRGSEIPQPLVDATSALINLKRLIKEMSK